MSPVEQPQAPADPKSASVVGNFVITLNMTQSRGISMTGYVYSDDDAAAVNRRIDSFQDALDRQYVRQDMVAKRAEIAGHEQNLVNMRDAYQALVVKQQSGRKLTSQEKVGVDNYDANVKRATEYIASLQAAINAGEKKLGTV